MKNVLLICENGISSNFLLKSAKSFMEVYDAQFNLISADYTKADTYLDSNIDLVLIAPQASYHDKEIKMIDGRAKVKTIPDDVYGWANGEKLVKFIMNEFTPAEAM
ncbi:PTS lactose transporter subunit IIB [Lentilactobacillus hilgardii]|jgi:PTS system cellobiose-specific IIB component|uniref:PTS lactose transporter subunit IIB n=1 Tax=Lentilactobacillus hilgardii TaxID=1588 RepID=A0A6P1ECL8_LENHI|nr:PTS lactose transporter subunit IIB [Lentilactobacillus hilgardii]EEI69855.1 PTS system, Lactose/Cellobiose specific IIB subunit [Lentilactobacillus hilgardii ATCC 27305]MCT3390686.1 PTS lactose transporter subunit IIB [Lentilactobacillus hilgardii]QHB52493.1 PTS lactose transporter subunit IIB [Lentilactobacillus hilgardii]RRG11726.1 MAG: PTS lactose transporter subunit IIB [Lactobacillus sp.]